jgi:hypothetical protein
MLFTASSLLSALQLNGIVNYFAGSSLPQIQLGPSLPLRENGDNALIQRDAFLDSLVNNMTVPELGWSPYQPLLSPPNSKFEN